MIAKLIVTNVRSPTGEPPTWIRHTTIRQMVIVEAGVGAVRMQRSVQPKLAGQSR
jgi:hypothetical protein